MDKEQVKRMIFDVVSRDLELKDEEKRDILLYLDEIETNNTRLDYLARNSCSYYCCLDGKWWWLIGGNMGPGESFYDAIDGKMKEEEKMEMINEIFRQ